MLGAGSMYAAECFAESFIGTDFGIHQDLSGEFTDDWRAFNQKYIPVFLEGNPDKTRIGAGLACGAIWTVSWGIKSGDIVLCPDGAGHYHIAEITGDYFYKADSVLPHRRPVHWLSQVIDRDAMSQTLKNSTGSVGTVANISRYAEEIEKLIGVGTAPVVIVTDETVEDPLAFAMEKHLEDFLVANWAQTELGKHYQVYEEDGVKVGQQYLSDTGPIDVLAVSKDKKELLVVELKRGRASDVVVGQILRYMGYVQDVLAESNQSVRGAIIALEDDKRIRRALAMVPSVDFYRYQVNFRLVKNGSE
jgi:restriction system protein